MTLKRYLRLVLLRYHRRQLRPADAPLPVATPHVCRHCGHAFNGRLCPQCGMPGGWTRFTWRRLLNGFLDIWGLGNRPMFRSMGHLLWRPGYMVRDYLGGHYLSYFPPFKMLAVLTVFVAAIIWLLGIDTQTAAKAADPLAEAVGKSATGAMFLQVRDFFMGNALYRLLLQVLLLVVAVWIVFRRRGLNFVETAFAMVYFSCQMQLVSIAWLALTRTFADHSIFPYALPELLVTLLFIMDFRQLYGLRTWGAVWRTLVMTLVLAVLYALVFVVLGAALFGVMAVEGTAA
ncbi:MAG: DUF3667 domain-containing protein [Bacteroidaceae bacterium]|nr:DUF3667 domain-containing protein [Bacteroidaceae bacterium]